jgi:hypothetical protein
MSTIRVFVSNLRSQNFDLHFNIDLGITKLSSINKFNVNNPVLIWPYTFRPNGAIFRGSRVKAACFTIAVDRSVFVSYTDVNY